MNECINLDVGDLECNGLVGFSCKYDILEVLIGDIDLQYITLLNLLFKGGHDSMPGYEVGLYVLILDLELDDPLPREVVPVLGDLVPRTPDLDGLVTLLLGEVVLVHVHHGSHVLTLTSLTSKQVGLVFLTLCVGEV
jgi:hypothetical protein